MNVIWPHIPTASTIGKQVATNATRAFASHDAATIEGHTPNHYDISQTQLGQESTAIAQRLNKAGITNIPLFPEWAPPNNQSVGYQALLHDGRKYMVALPMVYPSNILPSNSDLIALEASDSEQLFHFAARDSAFIITNNSAKIACEHLCAKLDIPIDNSRHLSIEPLSEKGLFAGLSATSHRSDILAWEQNVIAGIDRVAATPRRELSTRRPKLTQWERLRKKIRKITDTKVTNHLRHADTVC